MNRAERRDAARQQRIAVKAVQRETRKAHAAVHQNNMRSAVSQVSDLLAMKPQVAFDALALGGATQQHIADIDSACAVAEQIAIRKRWPAAVSECRAGLLAAQAVIARHWQRGVIVATVPELSAIREALAVYEAMLAPGSGVRRADVMSACDIAGRRFEAEPYKGIDGA